MIKSEIHLDFPAGQQHTPGYSFLQGSSPGFNPPVSSGLFDDPALADRRGTEWPDKKSKLWVPSTIF
jgi:hypothetical protein